MVPNSRGQQPMKVGAVLHSGSGVSCASETLVAEFKAHDDGIRIVHPMRKSATAKVSDGHEMSIQEQALLVHVILALSPCGIT